MQAVDYKLKPYSEQGADKYLFKKVFEYLKPLPSDEILEIGCARGFLTRELQKKVPATQGVDLDGEAIKNGVAKNLRVMDASSLSFPDKCFDKICSCHVIEHIPDTGKFLKEAERVLKPGGKFLLVYPFEIVRGMMALRSSIKMFGDISSCRKLHVHSFRPMKIRKLLRGTRFKYVESHFFPLMHPQYFTLLEKKK